MRKIKRTYSNLQLVSSICMILALLWLTVSAPFVYASQQELAKQNQTSKTNFPVSGNEEEANPFGSNSEEKAPNSSNSFSEEYLHDHHKSEHFFLIASQYQKCENAGTYVAFHGELLVPPPNVA